MKYDVAIIGGGPAGMMAAGRAGELGARVILIEKNKDLGIKLLMTGGGRCNLTHFTEKARDIADKFGENGVFLFSALHAFSVAETMRFFEERGVELKVEEDGRVFPKSDKAFDVLDALKEYMRDSHIEVRTDAKVTDIQYKDNEAERIILESGEEIEANALVVCTGGLSYPASGSTGDGYGWAKKTGHAVTKLYPSLVPIVVREDFVKELEGLSLSNVEISFYKDNKKIESRRGAAIFTANGLGGPIISAVSKEIGKQSPGVLMKIDFKPELTFEKLDRFLQKDFLENRNKLIRNGLERILLPKLIPVVMILSRIDPTRKINSISKEERKMILHLIKEFSLSVIGTAGFGKARVTSGGIKLCEIDPKIMRSRLVKNMFFAGEVLDLDGETGGYNLQMCWSSGYVAGESAAKNG